ncbi:MAG TPA: LLM class flavin-dependent oxidoreductase [Labilithrix sp.]
MRLSVLDLSPVPAGSTPAQALANTLDLARHAEAIGMHRYWLAEHHNAASVASSSPQVMIAAVASATKRIRVGSGGVMLPNHSALVVAEAFRVLHALHPGRIDLGVGRAPGTDPKTALALRRSRELLGAEGFPEQLDELLRLLTHDPDPNVPFNAIKAVPTGVPPPEVWLLGSGGDGATLAARRGLGFAFAHHFDPSATIPSLAIYRDGFRAPPWNAEPQVIVATAAICGDDDAHADRLASSGELAWLRFGQGVRDLPLPTPEEALAYAWDEVEEQHRAATRGRQIRGGPARVADALRALAESTGASELMITTHVHDHEERKRSYARIVRALA